MSEFKATILIVDDMQTNISVLASMLKDRYHIKIAKSGERALEIVSHGGVDLILLDVVMPQMDGYEVCRILKSDANTKDIPVIFVTANTSKEDEEKGFKLGAVDYITKPSTRSTVRARVNAHTNLRLRQIELEKLTNTMREQNEKLSRYTNVIDQYVITSSTDLDGVITYVSDAFCKISGYSKEELIGAKQSIVRHPDMPESLFKNLWETIEDDRVWDGEIKNLKKNGGIYWVKAHIAPDFKDGVKIGYTAVREDITDKKMIEEISITDGLTNIFNRRHFNETFPKVINSAKRDDELVSFLLLDIDYFKPYNDNYGHQAGDDVLVEFAKCLKNSLNRADDLAFRLGGEEFGVLFKSDTKQKALEFANTLRKNIEDLKLKHEYNKASSYVTASMGLFCKNASEINDMDEAYKQADDLLYEAKKSGRNQVKADIS
ncbi:MAG: diguanylate cyclase [Campylobacterales bacterium]